MKTALVLGAGGFIGSHLVRKLKKEGYWVRGVDIKHPDFSKSEADDFAIYDLRDPRNVEVVMRLQSYGTSILNCKYYPQPFAENLAFDEVYQLAADMGGAGYIFTGEHDADVMHNSAIINLNVVKEAVKQKVKKVFYSSSACMYPEHNQLDPNNPNCEESSAYPANPDSEYGWEKLFSERLYLAYNRNYGLNVRVARFHNIFGPEGTWKGGKEKAPAAMCRKAAETPDGGELEVWGDGAQTRSFLYIDECLDAMRRFMNQETFLGPVNIGSEEMVTINELAKMAINASGKNIKVVNMFGSDFEKKYGFKCPIGVRGRNSDNRLYKEKIGWEPTQPLKTGINLTFEWIKSVLNK
jgi:GDP-D-mannose 3',5'-epimerase